jgi:N-methylhydantoinase A
LRIPSTGSVGRLEEVITTFHAEHRRRFGYAMPDRPVEIVTARLTARADRPSPPLEAAPTVTPQAPRFRPVWFATTGFVETPIYQRDAISRIDRIRGPAIIEQMDTTTVVPPGWVATIDTSANLVLTHGDS